MIDFTFRQLEYFRTVALQGSVSAAAAKERVSRSALAAAISDLERALGRRLFTRQKAKGMALTSYGTQLLKMSIDVLESAGRISASLQGDEPSGRLGIGCPASLGPTIMPALFDHFRVKHPGVTLMPHPGAADELVALLRAGEIELAVLYGLRDEPDIEAVELYTDHMHVILPADHRLANRPRVRAAELVNETLVQLDAPPGPENVRNYFAAQGFLPRAQYRFQDYEVVRSLVARGVGYSIVIERQASGLSYEGLGVVARPLDPVPSATPVSCVWLSEHDLTPSAREARTALLGLAKPLRELPSSIGAEG